MEKVDHTVYLGGIIDQKLDARKEVQSRISSTFPILKSLDIFWRKAECPIAWKLQVYNAVMEHPKRSAKDRKLSSAAEKTTGAADRAGDEKKRFLLSPEFKKGITFCAMNLLPFDAIQLKSFQYFGAKKRHTKLYSSLEMPELEDLGSTVKQVKEEFLKRGIDRISETSNFYKGIPFLRVTVQPDFVPRPLVTISFVKDKGVLERLNLLADQESCTAIRSADPKILTGENAEYSNEFLVPVVQKIFAAYGLGGIWESVVSVGCTSDLGYFTNYVHAEYQKNSSERMGCVEKYLNPSAHVPSSVREKDKEGERER